MRILHVLDHSLPLHSGYTFRTRAIVTAQIAKGLEIACLTGARHSLKGPDPEIIGPIHFYRTPAPPIGPSPLRESSTTTTSRNSSPTCRTRKMAPEPCIEPTAQSLRGSSGSAAPVAR